MANPNIILELSSNDQLPFIRGYTQFLLGFPLPCTSHRPEVIQTLEKAANKLAECIPYLKGKVVDRQTSEETPSSGHNVVVPFHDQGTSIVQVKDLDDFQSYAELSKAQVPASMLDENITAPMKGLPAPPDPSTPLPVLVIRANFLTGGLLLCFSGMHHIMDATGLGQLVRSFAILCRGHEIATKDIEAALSDRRNVPPPLRPDQVLLDHSDMRKKKDPGTELDEPQTHKAPSVWFFFRISAAKLIELKAEASKNTTPADLRVTANDALSAFVWWRITAARYSEVHNEKKTLLFRAVNGRQLVSPPIPNSYIGNSVHAAREVLSMQHVAQKATLPELTQRLRKSTNEINDHYVRSFATFLRTEPDLSNVNFGNFSTEYDLLVSSWAALPVFADFGAVLGKPDFVRRPTGVPWRSVMYMMPKSPDGSIDFEICLLENELAILKDDETWNRFIDFMG